MVPPSFPLQEVACFLQEQAVYSPLERVMLAIPCSLQLIYSPQLQVPYFLQEQIELVTLCSLRLIYFPQVELRLVAPPYSLQVQAICSPPEQVMLATLYFLPKLVPTCSLQQELLEQEAVQELSRERQLPLQLWLPPSFLPFSLLSSPSSCLCP